MTAKTDTQMALAWARTALAQAKVSVKELVEAVKVEKEKALQAKATAKEAKRKPHWLGSLTKPTPLVRRLAKPHGNLVP